MVAADEGMEQANSSEAMALTTKEKLREPHAGLGEYFKLFEQPTSYRPDNERLAPHGNTKVRLIPDSSKTIVLPPAPSSAPQYPAAVETEVSKQSNAWQTWTSKWGGGDRREGK